MDDRRFTLGHDPQPDRLPLLRIAARLAFIEGAEEDSRRRPPLTVEELRRVLRRYPGD